MSDLEPQVYPYKGLQSIRTWRQSGFGPPRILGLFAMQGLRGSKSRLESLTTTLHGIAYVLKDSSHVTYSPGNYRYSNDDVFN
ncbi:hypothetical protein TNCV_4538891 [Trichonephila clavipes]|uniref:Uncharacterized protein n=1 Tax=Trichonephila clavipes TaxID=2585209 RepID=A0A8X7BKC9_TRICX|nr:hypothetical protein TNCV_4538891 [Trichonephila clavipes]